MNKKLAIVSPWPKVKNAEYEVIERIKISARKLDYEVVVIDGSGFILNDKNQKTVLVNQVEFVISIHPTISKGTDNFYYGLLWNPPSYIAHHGKYQQYHDNYRCYDAFVGYGNESVNDQIKFITRNTKIKLVEDIHFYPSVPSCFVIKPNLQKDFKMFYCGINWEKCSNLQPRHEAIFKSLDQKNLIKFFGPKKYQGIKPWKRYKNYQYPIEFDGFSILKEINECGVSLLLSSDDHRKYGCMSNRLYESAAAGAVVISDNNSFVKDNFGDCVLYIDYNGDQNSALQQIYQKIEWIKNNPKDALRKARKLQEIFLTKFTLEQSLKNLINSHEAIKLETNNLQLSKSNEVIDIVLRWIKDDTTLFERTINCINEQLYSNLNLIIICDEFAEDDIRQILSRFLRKNITYLIKSQKIFNRALSKNNPKYRTVTTGEMTLSIIDDLKSDYVAFLDGDNIWFSDHISTLKRTAEENQETRLILSKVFLGENTYLTESEVHSILLKFDESITISAALIKKDLLLECGKGILNFIDCFELQLYYFALVEKKDSIGFSKRMTVRNNFDSKITAIIQPHIQSDIIFSTFFTECNNAVDISNLIYQMKRRYLRRKPFARLIAKLFFGKKSWQKTPINKQL